MRSNAHAVEQQAAEGAEAQLAFYAWAIDQFGGRDEFFKWADEQDDPQAAMVELAEEYLLEGQNDAEEDGEGDEEPSDADLAFSEWVSETVGEEAIAQLSRLSDAEYGQAMGELGEAFLAEHPEHAPEAGGEGGSVVESDGFGDDAD
jgi:hypothetical protein